jgi:hypothetical protein
VARHRKAREAREVRACHGSAGPFKGAGHRGGTRPSIGLLESKRAINHARELSGDLGHHLGETWRGSCRRADERFVSARCDVHKSPREQREHRRSERPDIRAWIDITAEGLLGCHECGRADRTPRAGRGRCIDCLEETSNTEIQDAYLAFACDEQIFGFYVAMNYSVRMSGREDVKHVARDSKDLSGQQLAAGSCSSRPDSLANEKGHHEEGAAFFGYIVVDDGDDPRMFDLVCEQCLSPEAPFTIGIRGQSLVQDFDRHGMSVAVHARVNGGHPADADQTDESVAPAQCHPDALERPVHDRFVDECGHVDFVGERKLARR